MKEKKMLIGVTGPDRGGFTAWNFTRFALMLAGADAVRITPSRQLSGKKINGLIIGGGSDISPDLYGHSAHHRTVHIDYKRDKMEIRLLKELLPLKLPILGICRGAQLINVYLGGVLNQNIHDQDLQYRHKKTPFANKKIVLQAGSLLVSIVNNTRLLVNSIHHQAIEQPGNGLQVVAKDNNNIIQAIEHSVHPFMLGVQWHPEYMPQNLAQRAIFSALVHAAQVQYSIEATEDSNDTGRKQ